MDPRWLIGTNMEMTHKLMYDEIRGIFKSGAIVVEQAQSARRGGDLRV